MDNFLLTFETTKLDTLIVLKQAYDKSLIIFNKINKCMPYKMMLIIIYLLHVLVLIVFGSLLANTAHAGVNIYDPVGVDGCEGTAILEPQFKKGDIE